MAPPRPSLDTLSSGKKRIPRSNKQATQELARIYQQIPPDDFDTLRRRAARERAWLYIVVILLVGIIGAGVWFFYFRGEDAKFGEEAVNVALTGPASAPSGQIVEYIFSWENDQGVDLTFAEVNFRYPTGFTISETNLRATNEQQTRFNLGNIAAREMGELKITGQLVGEVGELQEFSAVFTYEPANFRAQFAKTIFTSTELVASVLNLELDAPPQLPQDQDLSLKVTYNNTSTNALANLALKLSGPSGFELELPSLEAVPSEHNLWRLPPLEAKSDNELSLVGRFTTAASAGEQDFAVAIGIVNEENNFTIQEEKQITVTLIESHLTLTLTANQVALKSYADWGEQIDFELRFANEGEVTLSNVVLTAKLDTKLLDWTTWQADTIAKVDDEKGTAIWTKKELPSLSTLAPGVKGNIHFRLSLVSVQPNGTLAPHSFGSKVEATAGQRISTSIQNITAESNTIVTKVNTQLLLQTEGRYYTDQLVKIGSGPLPPRVGETTTYVLFWRLSNTLNEAISIEVTTTLPQDVTWTGQTTVSAGQPVTYNPNTREVRWTLNRLPPGAGFKFTKPEASFEVAITPSAQDADKILVLIKTTTVTARDAFSGADLIATAKLVTTELDNDLGAQGKGVVVR
ncbi:MAG: hypothetical protein ABIJ81_02880 [Patescibacteria group bacterium]